MAQRTHVQVWMFPGRAWDKGYTGSVGLADGAGVGGVVKTCSDGALNDRNMRVRVIILKLHACFS